MEIKDALDCLADGHMIWTVKDAKEICAAIGVPFDAKSLVYRYKSDPPGTFKGLTMNPGCEDAEGVNSLVLSHYVAKQLNVDKKAGDYIGRGFQARAYAEAVKTELQNRGILKKEE